MKPYVYIIQNKEQTHWYVGMRSANRCPANEDTGYWGSSKYLKELIKNTGKENWTKTIISEFDTPEEASAHEVELLELMWDWQGRVNKNINGYVDHYDPEVKANHLAGIQKKAQDPEYREKKKAMYQDPTWQANTRAANQKKAQDPEWRANQKTGAQKRSEDPEYIAKLKAAAQKRSEDPEWRAKQKAASKIANQKRAKPFIATSITTGEEYYCESARCDQAKRLKLNSGHVASCLNGKSKQHKGFTFRFA